ncbi:MAG TPA: PP2C family protein-serine/threonine phosphatase [Streptosporangiaceae bacterium]|nr:PP2C family protein-serine/threonine phosphatase [Streptosporangiaceae bacterium]
MCQEPVIWSRTQVALGVLPYLVLAAVVVIDVMAGHGIGLLALLSLGPAFAAVVGGLTRMIIVSCLALALCLLLATYQDWAFDVDDQVALVTVLGVSVAGVIASTLRQRQERELADVRTVAEAAQQVLLRPVPAEPGAVRIAVRYISATSRATIGGDLYEVIAAADATRFIIGDVQGKGLAAVKLASTVLGAFREVAPDTSDLAVIATRIEATLARELTDEQFVTAIVGQVSADGSKVELLNRGHPPPLLMDGDGPRLLEVAGGGLPLGLAPLAAGPGRPAVIEVGPGDRILFYTDGVSEARSRSGEFFPLAQCRAVRETGDPDQTLDVLSAEVLRHVGHALDDDAAMLLIGRQPA